MNAFIKVAEDKFSQQQLTEQISPSGSEIHGLYLWESKHSFDGTAFKVT